MSGSYPALDGEPRFDKSKHMLGPLCKHEHRWNDTDKSLRLISTGRCVECSRQAGKKSYYANLQANRDVKRARMAVKREDPAEHKRIKERNRQNIAARRAALGRESRAKGLEDLVLPPGQALSVPEARAARELVSSGVPLDWKAIEPLLATELELQQLRDALMRRAGRSPSVARLVMNEQRRYWRENPEAKEEHDRWWAQEKWWLEYQTRPELRLYNRQKSKRRKAQIRSQTAHQIKPRHILDRFAQFDHRCAYCGAEGDMQIEHVVPIAKGGTHAMGNIVPACQRCNYSKHANEVESWYRAQPFFSELRWRKVCRVLNWNRGAIGQLALL